MLYRNCSVPQCERDHHSRGLCVFHYRCSKREGGQDSYSAVHGRLNEVYGPARERLCVEGCGRQASEWSYGHGADNALRTSSGVWYSTDPSQYQPRCKPCHSTIDKRQRQEELRARATDLETEIRHAIAERKGARDSNTKAHWDDELDRLSGLILTG